MLAFLNRPLPVESSITKKLKLTLFAGLLVSLVILVLRPIGLLGHGATMELYLQWAALLGSVCSLIIFIHFTALPFIFKSFFEERNWKVWKQVVLVISVFLWMTAFVEFVDVMFGNQIFSWYDLSIKLYASFLIGLFPVTATTLLQQNILLRRYSREAHMLDQQVHQEFHQTPHKSIELRGDNKSEFFSCAFEQLQFIRAADNYVQIFYLEEGKVKSEIIRSSMKNVMASLAGDESLYRCHRSYLVNLSQVVKVSGNAQGYQLYFKNSDEWVPVSRALNSELRGKLHKLFHSP